MRHKYSKDGDKIYSVVRVKIFMPGNARNEKHVFHAEKGQGFTADGVDMLLRKISDTLEKDLPGHEFNLIELRDNTFNFVWKGRKAKDQAGPVEAQIEAAEAIPSQNEGIVAAAGVGSNLQPAAR